ncbi:MAG: MFS transporter [Chloroflexota bacterium]
MFTQAQNLLRKTHAYTHTFWWRLSLYFLATITIPLSITFLMLRQRRFLESVNMYFGNGRFTPLEVLSAHQNLVLVLAGIIIISAWAWGAISDKVGRRPIFSVGFLLMAIGLAPLPRIGITFNQVYLYQSLFALGFAAAATMLTTSFADLFAKPILGRAASLTVVGIVLALLIHDFFLGQPLLNLLSGLQLNNYRHIYKNYLAVAALNFLMAILIIFGYPQQPNPTTDQRKKWVQLTREAFSSVRNSKIALAFVGAFISRGTFISYLLFFYRWLLTLLVIFPDGIDKIEIREFTAYRVLQIVTVLSTLAFGFVVDYVQRKTAVILALTFSAIGLGSTLFLQGLPLIFLYLAVAFIGLGIVCTMIASNALIAELAPPNSRGAIIGIFTSCAALGIFASVGAEKQLAHQNLRLGLMLPFSFLGLISLLALIIYRIRH